MIEIGDVEDLQKLRSMLPDRPEKVKFAVGEGFSLDLGEQNQVTLVKEEELDVELACVNCFFRQSYSLCVKVPCEEPESVFFRSIDLGE
jgi:hypothetical protein